MPATNTATSYGSVTRTFHWLTALLILTAFPLGIIANGLPFETAEQLNQKAVLFSAHKTVGILAFLIGVARIVWALTQAHVVPLHPDRSVQTWAASVAHWVLYISLVLVPLSGWLHHAATEGFAPVWLPFGDDLPFVPKNVAVAEFFAGWHFVFTKILGLAVLAHIAGALKHHVMDRDDTLRRMLGSAEGGPADYRHTRGPLVGALAIWAVALAGGTALGLTMHHEGPATPALEAVASDWAVQDGSIGFTVIQMGGEVEGQFADWTAVIAFDPDATEGEAGSVEVTMSVPSVTVGSVTDEALKPEFFDAETHPTATYAGTLMVEEGQYRSEGTLTLRGTEAPVNFPFDLTVEGDTATMSGSVTLQRLDFGVGAASYQDDGTVGLEVVVNLAVTATRSQ
ncbi:MAG: cytochrome b/b6 domain-containing protein [Pseudomonadota bacterium]